MEKYTIEVYSYATLCCTFQLALGHLPEVGDPIEVNFDDPEVEFLGGVWDRPTGCYEFKIHGHGFSSDFGPAYSQLEMEDEEL